MRCIYELPPFNSGIIVLLKEMPTDYRFVYYIEYYSDKLLANNCEFAHSISDFEQKQQQQKNKPKVDNITNDFHSFSNKRQHHKLFL
jgi:hypothetical protein